MKKLGPHEAGSDPALAQYGALCYRRGTDGAVEVLLITSRDTGRWIIPKGWPMKRRSGSQSAAREAYEEAGVKGRLHEGCVGYYSYGKGMPGGAVLPVVVSVFAIEVSRLASDFPESEDRRRKWFSPVKAAERVAEPELRALLAGFAPDTAARGAQA
ncbi:MAG: NUDIX hydrolase [Alphaproteobacteria bacterium HGW-Alphaproteobacteria-6]|nr:MAG: NUDIX hydrolase [Alphaproteobacteria bacterium HGW-Alphaproteobacteria-6]